MWHFITISSNIPKCQVTGKEKKTEENEGTHDYTKNMYQLFVSSKETRPAIIRKEGRWEGGRREVEWKVLKRSEEGGKWSESC